MRVRTFSYKPEGLPAPSPRLPERKKIEWPRTKRQFSQRIADLRYQRAVVTEGMTTAARQGKMLLSDEYRKRRFEIDLELIKLGHDAKDAPE